MRNVNGGLGRQSAAIEENEDDQPAKNRPDVGQMPSVPLVAGRTRRVDHCVAAVNGQGG